MIVRSRTKALRTEDSAGADDLKVLQPQGRACAALRQTTDTNADQCEVRNEWLRPITEAQDRVLTAENSEAERRGEEKRKEKDFRFSGERVVSLT
jgi:hypothetical protein